MHEDTEYDFVTMMPVWYIVSRPADSTEAWRPVPDLPNFPNEKAARLMLSALRADEMEQRGRVDRIPVVFNYSYDEVIGFADILDNGTAVITITDTRLVRLIEQDKKDTVAALTVTFTPAENANVSRSPSSD